jgi:hypothetical protein
MEQITKEQKELMEDHVQKLFKFFLTQMDNAHELGYNLDYSVVFNTFSTLQGLVLLNVAKDETEAKKILDDLVEKLLVYYRREKLFRDNVKTGANDATL